MKLETVLVDKKGRLAIPEKLRKDLKVKESDEFLAYTENDCIVFKKVRNIQPEERFSRLAQEARAQVKSKEIPKDTVDEAIKWARGKK